LGRFISLTRLNGLGTLPTLFEQRAGETALWSIFEREGLPLGTLDAPETPIPLATLIGLMARASDHVGDRLFAFDVGEAMALSAFGVWGAYGRAAPTFEEGLRRYFETFDSHQSGSSMRLELQGKHGVWRYYPYALDLDYRAHSDHLVPTMLQFARIFLGNDWAPDWIEINYPRDAAAHLLEARLQTEVRFAEPCIGIAIRTSDLVGSSRTERLTQSQPVTLREVNADLLLANAPEPARALSAIVTLRLLDGHTDIDGAARMAQMSVQSLQRRLRDKGFTYREIVGLARQRRAESLLAETEMRIVDIALALGYEEHANFTRAFKAAAGVSPADFRRACRQPIEAHTRPKRQLPG